MKMPKSSNWVQPRLPRPPKPAATNGGQVEHHKSAATYGGYYENYKMKTRHKTADIKTGTTQATAEIAVDRAAERRAPTTGGPRTAQDQARGRESPRQPLKIKIVRDNAPTRTYLFKQEYVYDIPARHATSPDEMGSGATGRRVALAGLRPFDGAYAPLKTTL